MQHLPRLVALATAVPAYPLDQEAVVERARRLFAGAANLDRENFTPLLALLVRPGQTLPDVLADLTNRLPTRQLAWSGLARSLCCERRRTRPWPRRACLRFRFDRSWTSPVFGAVP